MKNLLLSAALLLITLGLAAQNVGDTITIQSFNFNSSTRDTTVSFPVSSSVTYEKILMQYTMRCKDGLVSTSANRNLGCGEWDYSCNTNIEDPDRVDSVLTTTKSHSISGYSGNTYVYSTSEVSNYFQYNQKSVTATVLSETSSTVGTNVLNASSVLNTVVHGGKSQHIFTASELTTSGLTAGDIDALTLNITNTSANANFLRVRLKEVSGTTTLDPKDPQLNGFTEVYFNNTPLTTGANRFQFYTPFTWDGISQVIIELSFSNSSGGLATQIGASSALSSTSSGDNMLTFDGSNYIESDGDKVISGSQNRTVEAWIKTPANSKEICGWGTNSSGQKWLVRLDGSGRLRCEVNGGYRVGTTVLNDDEWHHIAVVLNGTSTSDISLFVDGVQEAITNTGVKAINTGNTQNLRIGRVFHNLYWIGEIADVRIWNDVITSTNIYDWRYRKVTNSHPQYTNLVSYFPLNEGAGDLVIDNSSTAINASIINSLSWSQISGVDHFKNFEYNAHRPQITLHQGTYNLTVTPVIAVDTIPHYSNIVNEYQVISRSGTSMNDSIDTISINTYWEASFENTYDTNGALLSSIPVTADGTINVTDLPFYQRAASVFEIMSFVTPYGIGLDFGMEGKTWTFDVTDYTPFLHGDKRIYMNRGGEWQEDMDIKFLFIVGTPERDVLDVSQIWKVSKVNYDKIMDNTYFPPRDVPMNAQGQSFKIRSMITGHGQEGEFIPRNHYVNVNGGNPEFNWQVWTTCGDNPVYPQGGTWIYDRAGWCPGEATMLEESNITNLVTAGQTANIDYGLTTATGTSSYIVNHQLVTYGAANHTLDASIVDIISPTNSVKHARVGQTCIDPTITLRNSGSAQLNNVVIEYWVNDDPNKHEFTWKGFLNFQKTIDVVIPAPFSVWGAVSGPNNVFHVRLKDPNGGTDENIYNDEMASDFVVPEVLPTDFNIRFRTNTKGSENSYEIVDDIGTVVFSRNNMASNTLYTDSLTLPFGCYKMKVLDTGGNGINFWANSDGAGYIQIWETGGGLKTILEPDFGNEITYNFTVDALLSVEDQLKFSAYTIYPNPAGSHFAIKGADVYQAEVIIYNAMGQQIEIPSNVNKDEIEFNTNGLAKGMYFINIITADKIESKTVVLN